VGALAMRRRVQMVATAELEHLIGIVVGGGW